MTDELKPCPFCGSQPWSYDDANHSTAWEVECGNTTCSAQPSVWKATKVEAIAAWNNRKHPPADMAGLDGLIELLAAKREYYVAGAVMQEWVNPDGPVAATQLQALKAENERLREAVRHYAEEFCELSPANEICGKLTQWECSGCIARTALERIGDD